MNMSRIRSESSLEALRADERTQRFKREAGLALLFIALRGVERARCIIRVGWALFKAGCLRKKEWCGRRELLLAKRDRSKMRRRWVYWKERFREEVVKEGKVTGLERMGEIMRRNKQRRWFWRWTRVVRERGLEEVKGDIGKAAAVSLFAKFW
jgi:hypothetical protein